MNCSSFVLTEIQCLKKRCRLKRMCQTKQSGKQCCDKIQKLFTTNSVDPDEMAHIVSSGSICILQHSVLIFSVERVKDQYKIRAVLLASWPDQHVGLLMVVVT